MPTCCIVERFPSKLTESAPLVEDPATLREIETCFREAIRSINLVCDPGSAHPPAPHASDPVIVAEEVFRLLTSRPFNGYSRKACEPLRRAATAAMARFVRRGEPIRFYYDIGGGYSAAVSLDDLGADGCPAGLSFEPNGLHILCLAQVARFAEQVRRRYPPGIEMLLVIDNLVAHFVNDIRLEKTLEFCQRLRRLIDRLGLQDLCGLLIESEHSPLRRSDVPPVTDRSTETLGEREYENVLRFTGRRLPRSEAARRQRLYAEVTALSEKHLEAIIDGVHLTQRLGSSTLPFRPFPGGSARIQAGRLCFFRNTSGRIIPQLLTSSNSQRYQLGYAPVSLQENGSRIPVAELVGGEPAICQPL